MNNLCIDELTERINNSKTKEYFSEVLSSFYSENYRSAVVMLYSVVICDLVFKLKDLAEIYADDKAEKILAEIEKLQAQNPKSPDWEKYLIEAVFKETKLLEAADKANIDALQQHRNLCAHPVIKNSFDLFMPNRITVQAHIVNMLDGILVKPAIMLKNLTDSFLDDLSNIKSILLDKNQIEKYIVKKYLDKLNIEIEYKLFRSLWKLTLKTSDDQCDENRNVNFIALNTILKRHTDDFVSRIGGESEFFSSQIEINDSAILKYAVCLFNDFPEVFKALTVPAQTSIEGRVKSDSFLKDYAIFASKDLQSHLLTVDDEVQTNVAEYLLTRAIESLNLSTGLEFAISVFENSRHYDNADSRFKILIEPHLYEFSKEQLEHIISSVNSNSQIHGRRDAIRTNKIIYERFVASGGTLDSEKYPYFSFS